ncbi:hypothetical protein ACIA48_23890 [Mycobacterium sp. NPDC051804]|uniref:hypothetical protein n=1 Tax=Mycobacterium sp. NPDC051804 TaxID=3364295 RepID=UPI0037947F36
MQRPSTWKIAVLSAALGGLSIAGAGTALADIGSADVAPLSITAPIPEDWPSNDLDDLDDAVRSGWNGHIVGLDDDWDDDDWDDDNWDDDWDDD